MTDHTERLTDRDLATLAAATETDPVSLRADLQVRPWKLHEILSDPDVFDTVMDRRDHPAAGVSPYLLFAVLVHRVAAELRAASYVNDWSGPRSRLPVFDVEPLQEFVGDTSRLFFLTRLLSQFVAPSPPPVPADPLDLSDMARWLDSVLPHQRVALLRRLGDLSLFLAGVYPDRTGPLLMGAQDALILGETAGMSSDDILVMLDPGCVGPGLETMESLGTRWYTAAADAGGTPPVVRDIAHRFRAARRVLNHLTDGYLYHLDLRPSSV